MSDPTVQEYTDATAIITAADTAMLTAANTALPAIQTALQTALDAITAARDLYPINPSSNAQNVLTGYVSQFSSYKQAIDSMVVNVEAMLNQLNPPA